MEHSQSPEPSNSDTTSGGKRALEEGPVRMYSSAKRAKIVDPLARKAKHYGRVVEPFINIAAIAQWGLMKDDPERSITAFFGDEDMSEVNRVWHQKRLDFCYDKLLESTKDLNLEKKLEDPNQCNDIAREIEHARGLGRSDDTQGCKKGIIEWLGAEIDGPALNRRNKDKRGFAHPHIGRLLAPADVDWDDIEQRRGLITGSRVPRPEESPRVFWKDGNFNSRKFWDGFLRHELAVKAFKHIFTSPSSALEKSNGSTGRSTKKGNAANNHMRAVTLDSIAYIHLHLHHALSDVATFNRDDEQFSYVRFFNHLVRFLYEQHESESGRRHIVALLAWWNRRVFPVHHIEPTNHDQAPNSLSEMLAASANQSSDDEGQGPAEGGLERGADKGVDAGALESA